MALVLIGIGVKLWHAQPGYWVRNQYFLEQTSKARLTDLADQAFNRFVGELSDSRGYRGGRGHPPNDTGQGAATSDGLKVRTIRLSFNEANAWLDQRLGDWLVNQNKSLPAGLSSPMLAGEDGRLVLAVRVKQAQFDKVVSVAMSLGFTDDGRAVLVLQGAKVGRLPLPMRTLLNRFATSQDAEGTAKSQVLAFLQAQEPFDPILPIDGTRRARIIGLEMDDQGLSLTVQAESNGEH